MEEPDDRQEAEEGGMPFLEHLEEFRWTLVRAVIAFIVGVAVVAFFMRNLSEFLQYPLARAFGSSEVAQENLITKSPMGVFTVLIQVAFMGGFTLSLPFILYFIGAFVAPGLTPKERRILAPACMSAFVLFVAGVCFAFFFVLPMTIGISVKLNAFLGFTLLWTATDYFNLVVWFSLALGAFFQFPLLVLVLVHLRVVDTTALARSRRIVFVGIMIFSAFLTPGGDPFSLALMSGPMYLLYELSIRVGRRIERIRREEEAAEDPADAADDEYR